MTFLFGLATGALIVSWMAHVRISDLQDRLTNLDTYTRESLDEMSETIYGKDDAA
jgi:hypothetical protein